MSLEGSWKMAKTVNAEESSIPCVREGVYLMESSICEIDSFPSTVTHAVVAPEPGVIACPKGQRSAAFGVWSTSVLERREASREASRSQRTTGKNHLSPAFSGVFRVPFSILFHGTTVAALCIGQCFVASQRSGITRVKPPKGGPPQPR